MHEYVGLRNIVHKDKKWSYLLLYEIDTNDYNRAIHVADFYHRLPISSLYYKTLRGFHFVGLTPIDSLQWGSWFQVLQNFSPEYYAGQTLRITLKRGESQELIDFNFKFPYIERLARFYTKRFNIPEKEIPVYGEMPTDTLMFERYWSSA